MMRRVLSEDLNNPDLFVDNEPGSYDYYENAVGGKSACGSLAVTDDPKRDGRAQSSAGGEERRLADHEWGIDDGGHLIGARFGGAPSSENLTAQDSNLNRSAYNRMEHRWQQHLEDGDKVFVNIEATEGERPDAYVGYAIYESPDGSRSYETFSFVNESKGQIAQWEQDLADFEMEDLGYDGETPESPYLGIDGGDVPYGELGGSVDQYVGEVSSQEFGWGAEAQDDSYAHDFFNGME